MKNKVQQPKSAWYLVALILFFAILFLIPGSPRSVQAAPGNLDPSFGTEGIVTTPIGNVDDRINSLAIQSDGRLVAAGYYYNGSQNLFAIARYNTDGSLDEDFGEDAVTPIGQDAKAYALGIQGDGKLVAAGYSDNGSQNEFALVRYNTDGSLDTDFGTEGIVTTAIGTNDQAFALAIQSDGKLVAAGYSTIEGAPVFALVRYNTDGTLDTGFGTGGIVTTPIGANPKVYSLAIQSDGKLVAVGVTLGDGNNDFALVRYNTDGTLDSSFGSGGKVTTDFAANDDDAKSLVIQSDGKLVVGGFSFTGGQHKFPVARYNTNGTLDSTFGTGGIVTTAIGTADFVKSLAIQPDGKVVAAGYSNNGSQNELALVRYNTDGSLDATFGTNGIVTKTIGTVDDEANALAIQSDGKLVAAGFSNNGSQNEFALVRYLGGLTITIPTGASVCIADYNGTCAFAPNPLTIESGDSVVWSNTDGASHTATSDDHADNLTLTQPASPDNSFSTGLMSGGTSSGSIGPFINTTGIAQAKLYHCSLHAADMKGTLIILSAAVATTTTTTTTSTTTTTTVATTTTTAATTTTTVATTTTTVATTTTTVATTTTTVATTTTTAATTTTTVATTTTTVATTTTTVAATTTTVATTTTTVATTTTTVATTTTTGATTTTTVATTTTTVATTTTTAATTTTTVATTTTTGATTTTTVATTTTTGATTTTTTTVATTTTRPTTTTTLPGFNISGFTPNKGIVGASVTISGKGFTGATDVQFYGNSAAVSLEVLSSTRIRVLVPTGACPGTGLISVITPSGTATSAKSFTCAATITSFTPNKGPAGTIVTINGTGFADTTAVQFNTIPAADFHVLSPTKIQATVPADVGACPATGTISVSTGSGTVTSTNTFTCAATLTSFAPNKGPAGTIVTINGTGFTGTTDVQFNGTSVAPVDITIISSTRIQAPVPAGACPATGTIAVVTPSGTVTSLKSFTCAATLTSFTPNKGPAGTIVTINGTGFTGATDVQFNGISAVSPEVLSSNRIQATVPAGACGPATGLISVFTLSGTVISVHSFTCAATISSFTPGKGPAGTIVTINGTGFTDTSTVQFNGTSATPVTFLSSTRIQAPVPAGATTGPISVVTPSGTVTSGTRNFTIPTVTTTTTTVATTTTTVATTTTTTVATTTTTGATTTTTVP